MQLERLFRFLRLKLRSIVRRDTVERELEEEFRAHLEAKIAFLQQQGLSPTEAKSRAVREFGGAEQHKEECRDARGVRVFDELVRDFQYAIRSLTKNPGFTIVAGITIALGIGANTAIFTLVNGIFLKSLPFPEAKRLVAIGEVAPSGSLSAVPYSNYVDWRANQHVFEEMAARLPAGGILTGGAEPERVFGRYVSASFFSTLGILPQTGRFFTEGEDWHGGEQVIVISDRLWHRRFGGSLSAIGEPIQYNGGSWTLIGVLPRDFDFYGRNNENNEVFLPLGQLEQNDARGRGYPVRITARLKPGVTVQQARAEIQALARRSALQYPESDTGNAVDLRSFLSDYTGDAVHALAVISAAVVLLLIIACANVANLTLARTMKRQREIALRLALGASRSRVIRLLLTESVVLATVGGAIGVAIAVWAVEFFKAAAPESLPRLTDVRVDLIVLISTIALTLASGVLSGLTPAWQMTRADLDTTLRAGGHQISGSATSNRLRNILMVTEVALAFLLLVASGLLVKSFRNLMNEDRGYDARNVLNFRLRLPDTKYPEPSRSISMLKETQSRLSRLPGVEKVAIATAVPLGRFVQGNYWIEGTSEPKNMSQWLLSTSPSVSEGYHEALGIKLVAGRCFNDRDQVDSPAVVMVDDQFVRRNFTGLPYSSVLGRRLRFDGPNERWREIVGIVRHVKYHDPEEEPLVEIYRPWTQMDLARDADWLRAMDVVIKTSIDPWSILPAVRREVASLDRDQPLGPVITFESALEHSMTSRRVNLTLMSLFSGAALILGAVGLYGVLSYLVGQRRREIGVRLALGAQRRDVLQLILGNGMRLALTGIALGLIASFAFMHLLASLLYGVSATDPAIYTAITILLGAVALCAAYIPAKRAAGVDAVEALRYE